jgi:hypothetical protein
MYRFIFVILLTGISFSALPSVVKDTVITESRLRTDTGKITIRTFDQQKLAAYRKQNEFIYQELSPLDTSLWDRFWRWVWSWLGHRKGISKQSTSSPLIKYTVIAVLVALLVFLAFKITGLDLKIFSRRSKSVDIPYSESLDNIHEINFDEELTKAIAASNYRLAVRLFYLNALKWINDQNLIDWQPEKTNQIYVSEITDPRKKQLFTLLTTQFEYIWYGEFFIDEQHFNRVRADFDQFNKGTS